MTIIITVTYVELCEVKDTLSEAKSSDKDLVLKAKPKAQEQGLEPQGAKAKDLSFKARVKDEAKARAIKDQRSRVSRMPAIMTLIHEVKVNE